MIPALRDFSGGIDIILGISEMFGIRLPENFDRPFSSRSLAEFWRRWHMTLMQWFREYIFFPVSTSHAARKLSAAAGRLAGKKAAGKVPVYLASLTVWSVTGIWHGASWNWVLWGLANCVFMLLSQELSACSEASKAASLLRTDADTSVFKRYGPFLYSVFPGCLFTILPQRYFHVFWGF